MHLHAVTLSLGAEPGGDLRRKIPRKRRVSALRFGLAASRIAHHLDMADGLVDGHFEVTEIDRLGQEIKRTAVHRGTDVAHVAIGRNNDGRLLVLGLLQLLQQ